MHARIWGCRGSLATPGADTVRYGGNTSRVEVRLESGHLLILDAGTGIRPLGAAMDSESFDEDPHLPDPSASRPRPGARVLPFATKAGVGMTVLFHHDPYHTDDELEALLVDAQRQCDTLGDDVCLAHEGMVITLDRDGVRFS